MEQFGSVFWYLGLTSPSSGYKIQKNSKKNRFLFKINGFLNKKPFIFLKKKSFFVLLHRVPIATGTMNILCCRRGAPRAHLGLTFPSNGYKIPKNSKKPLFIKKNRFFLVCFRILSQSAHRHKQEEHIMLQTWSAAGALARSAAGAQRRRRVDPSRKKLVARAKRGSRALTRRGE